MIGKKIKSKERFLEIARSMRKPIVRGGAQLCGSTIIYLMNDGGVVLYTYEANTQDEFCNMYDTIEAIEWN